MRKVNLQMHLCTKRYQPSHSDLHHMHDCAVRDKQQVACLCLQKRATDNDALPTVTSARRVIQCQLT